MLGKQRIIPPELLESYNKIKYERKVDRIEEFPEYIRRKLFTIVRELEKKYGQTEMYLTGSYAAGSWIDEKSSQEFLVLKLQKKNHIKLSDFDIIIPGVEKNAFVLYFDCVPNIIDIIPTDVRGLKLDLSKWYRSLPSI